MTYKQQEQFEELAKLTGIYMRNIEPFMEDLHIYSNATSEGGDFHMLFYRMIETFPKDMIQIEDRGSTEYPYRAYVQIHSIRINALVKESELATHFPELIESEVTRLKAQLQALEGKA